MLQVVFLDAHAVAVGALLLSMVNVAWMTVMKSMGDLIGLCAGCIIDHSFPGTRIADIDRGVSGLYLGRGG